MGTNTFNRRTLFPVNALTAGVWTLEATVWRICGSTRGPSEFWVTRFRWPACALWICRRAWATADASHTTSQDQHQ
jgi:hypothetical protein